MTQKYGTARECEVRGFVVGDIIEGEECGHAKRLKIKFIGNGEVVFGELLENGEEYIETCHWTLSARQWRKVN